MAFNFPEGGWECGKCLNYNFKGRRICFRCQKPKDQEDLDSKPMHMFLSMEEKAALKGLKGATKPNQLAKRTSETGEGYTEAEEV